MEANDDIPYQSRKSIWMADDLAVSVELEPSYEETCRVLRTA